MTRHWCTEDKTERSGLLAAILFLVLFCVSVAGIQTTEAQATAFNDPSARGQGGAAGDLVSVENETAAGDISVGSTAQVVVLFRNDSGRPLTTGAIQLYPSSTVSAAVSLNQCSQEPLPAGASCAVALSVKGLQAGTWRVEMIMRHSGRARLVTASLSGQVAAGDDGADRFVSDIEAIPNELDFGALNNSQPVVRGVVLRNITSDPVEINAIYIESADRAGYSLRTSCARLDPGQACMVIVTWSPVLKGQAQGVLLVEHTGPTTVASIDLTGEFEPDNTETAEVFPEAVPGKGLMVASQDEIDFGTGIETTSAITVSLVNVGDAPLVISDIRTAGSDNGLSISKKGCGSETVLEPVEACPLTLSWSPVREGNILDDIHILHDGARGILVLPVRGESSSIVSQDTKAVRLEEKPVSIVDSDGTGSQISVVRDDNVDPASVLDGFVVTSHAATRAIISGPGGSRIIYNNEDVVIGGFLWKTIMRASGVEFRSGNEKVLLLFDRSLSSVNRTSSQSGGSSSGGGTGSDTTAETN